MLQNLHLTISKDLMDPLNLIFFVINWLMEWFEKLDSKTKTSEVYENMVKIMIASKMSTFKCKDLLELSGPSESRDQKQNMSTFKLDKVTNDITKIIELQARGK